MNSKTQKNHSLQSLFGCILIAAALSSCAVVDPDYAANYHRIPDTDYPASAIAGDWANVSADHELESTSFGSWEMEWKLRGDTKKYYEFRPGGRGTVLQHTRYYDEGNYQTPRSHISLQANIRWEYRGKNLWEIFLPASTEYKVLSNKGTKSGYIGPRSFTVRLFENKLYATMESGGFKGGDVMVRATAANIQDAATRARTQMPLIGPNL